MTTRRQPAAADLAVVGCGNLVRGDDGVGPVLIRHLWERGVPEGVRLIDGGTAGMDVAFQLRGVRRAVIVDACTTGAEPGTVFEVPAEQIRSPRQPASRNQHSFRWDNALAFGAWLLGDDMPSDIEVYLIEAKQTDVDAPLSPEVEVGMEQVIDRIAERWASRAEAAQASIPRPQPLGVFGLPAGFLLLPDAEGTDGVRAGLVAGHLPAQWPESLRGHELAYAGDVDGARAHFAAASDPVSRFNRYVLDRDSLDPALRDELGPLSVLIDLVAFTLGDGDDPPGADGTDGEVRALVLAAQAGAWSSVAPAQSLALLGEAIESCGEAPALRALLLAARADLATAQAGDTAGGSGASAARGAALADLRAAAELLADTDLGVARAEVALAAAMAHQDAAADSPGMGQLAISGYHDALGLIDRQVSPELFGTAHANLAVCYLTTAMAHSSDSLRYAVAVQSLRAALEVFTPEDFPAQWESAQLNLANALLCAPTLRQRENHMEAIDLLETVIAARRRSGDELGLARALANQGSALARLGSLDEADGRLAAAAQTFADLGHGAEAQAVRGVLAEVRELAESRSAGGAS